MMRFAGEKGCGQRRGERPAVLQRGALAKGIGLRGRRLRLIGLFLGTTHGPLARGAVAVVSRCKLRASNPAGVTPSHP